MRSRIAHLENETIGLKGEIAKLLYLKKTAAKIQGNEDMLRRHFGIGKIRSLEKTSGMGGEIILSKTLGRDQARGGPKPTQSQNSTGGIEMRDRLEGKLDALVSNHESPGRLKISEVELWEGTPNITPLDPENVRVSSPFGYRKNPFTHKKEFHAGVDFMSPPGTMVIAPANGKVFDTGYDQWMGNYIVLHHPAGFKTIYGHLSEIFARKGSEVRRGDPIGFVGNTGLSTSPHLHYGVIRGERAVDPMQFLGKVNS